MKYQQILSILNNEKRIIAGVEEDVRKYFHYGDAKKKEIILNADCTCDKIFFINKGIVRTYYINDKGNTITRMIASENMFLTNMISFRNFGNNIETFECLENTEYLYITRKELDMVVASSQFLRAKYCEIIERYNAIQIAHIHFIINSEAPVKIQYFKTNFPNLIGRINDNIIASFLGLSRETIVRHKSHLY